MYPKEIEALIAKLGLPPGSPLPPTPFPPAGGWPQGTPGDQVVGFERQIVGDGTVRVSALHFDGTRTDAIVPWTAPADA